MKKREPGKHYMISNVPVSLRKALKVASALAGITIGEYCVKALTDRVKRDGIVIEEND